MFVRLCWPCYWLGDRLSIGDARATAGGIVPATLVCFTILIAMVMQVIGDEECSLAFSRSGAVHRQVRTVVRDTGYGARHLRGRHCMAMGESPVGRAVWAGSRRRDGPLLRRRTATLPAPADERLPYLHVRMGRTGRGCASRPTLVNSPLDDSCR
jgi:hypothetical protein